MQALVLTAVGFALSRVWMYVKPYIDARFSVTQQEEIARWVKAAVAAAEQLAWLKTGAEKKAYVEEVLRGHSATIDDALLDTLIESAVYELKHKESA